MTRARRLMNFEYSDMYEEFLEQEFMPLIEISGGSYTDDDLMELVEEIKKKGVDMYGKYVEIPEEAKGVREVYFSMSDEISVEVYNMTIEEAINWGCLSDVDGHFYKMERDGSNWGGCMFFTTEEPVDEQFSTDEILPMTIYDGPVGVLPVVGVNQEENRKVTYDTYVERYLTFTTDSNDPDDYIEIGIERNYCSNDIYLEVSWDKVTWEEWYENTVYDFSCDYPLYVRGINLSGFSSNDYYAENFKFVMSAGSGMSTAVVKGDIKYLVDYRTDYPVVNDNFSGFGHMFEDNSLLGDVSGLVLSMMIDTTEGTDDMGCYRAMFGYCNNLRCGAQLPSKVLAPGCYAHLYDGCRSLYTISIMATDFLTHDDNCLSYWVYGVADNGTLTCKTGSESKIREVSYDSADSGIPSGWNVTEI